MTLPEHDIHRLALRTSDGVGLRAERRDPDTSATAAVVLCHPHPLHGGNMFSHVISGLFAGLPADGIMTLRFNFRGTSGSEGRHGGGTAEQLDVVAAIEAVASAAPEPLPIVLVGYSFGASVVLAVDHPRVAGWLGIAPPLTTTSVQGLVAGSSTKAKQLVVGDSDEFCSPTQAAELTADWPSTTITPLVGEDHFLATAHAELLAIAKTTVATLIRQL